MKKIISAFLLMSGSAAYGANAEAVSNLAGTCCAALAACCQIVLGCCG